MEPKSNAADPFVIEHDVVTESVDDNVPLAVPASAGDADTSATPETSPATNIFFTMFLLRPKKISN
jgi:hypothetical protein